MVGTLLAFGVAPDLALSSVLAYRAVAIWLPAPLGLIGARRAAGPRRALGARGRARRPTSSRRSSTPVARGARARAPGSPRRRVAGPRRPRAPCAWPVRPSRERAPRRVGPPIGRVAADDAGAAPRHRRQRRDRAPRGPPLRGRPRGRRRRAWCSRSPRRSRTSSRTPTPRASTGVVELCAGRPRYEVRSWCATTATGCAARGASARRGLRHPDHPPARAARRARRHAARAWR